MYTIRYTAAQEVDVPSFLDHENATWVDGKWQLEFELNQTQIDELTNLNFEILPPGTNEQPER